MGPLKIWTGGNKDLNKLILDKMKELDFNFGKADGYRNAFGYHIYNNNYVTYWSGPEKAEKSFKENLADEISIPDFLALEKKPEKIKVGCTHIEDCGDSIYFNSVGVKFSKRSDIVQNLVDIYEHGWFSTEIIDWNVRVSKGIFEVDGTVLPQNEVEALLKMVKDK